MNQPFDANREAPPYDCWAEHYDALIAGDEAAMDAFYVSLVGDETSAILELACGTGRVTGALFQRARELSPEKCVRVVGLDQSPAMLEFAQARAPDCEWIPGDMRHPNVAGCFDLIVCCYNSLQHILSEDELIQVFSSVKSLLKPDGRFAFDLYEPNEAYLRVPHVDRLVRTVKWPDGRLMELREDAQFDAESRVYVVSWALRAPGMTHAVSRSTQHHRQYTSADINRCLVGAGLRVIERFGDFARSEPSASTNKQVVVAGRLRD